MKIALKVLGALGVVAVIAAIAVPVWWFWFHDSVAQDEAKIAGLTPQDFPQSMVDYFKDMDGGIVLTPEEVAGRNTWIVWSAGNQAFFDFLANNSIGSIDFLKTLSSYPRSEEHNV